ncbi:MAG: hypothetical protein A2939_05150 [Parcubacteria group bacterium RIFCSPLOWO2_01_FULL_48_18]|nr:MAG: hypothetical protein A3J67_03375 [Parcubacteria group bacterium RIFCSPHIGHO2_02_FULL_48_10b]OHB22255.1 MAG: hypothetical protein A2939_05150 [Parcubacteria group bacterium RIFCSPLOWO2_01_FULL_48_18]
MKKLLIFIPVLVFALLAAAFGLGASNRDLTAGFFQDLIDLFRFRLNPDAPRVVPPPNEVREPAQDQSKTEPYAPAADYENAVVGAVEKAAPAVVSIVITKDLPVIERCPYDPYGDLPPEFDEFFGPSPFQFYRQCQKGTKKQEVGGGTGFVVSSDGLVVTNKHVVADEDADYTVLTNDGGKYNAKVLARDPVQDLAVLRVDKKDLPTVALGDSDSIKLGQTAIVIGNALGEFRNTVSVGVISGLARTITAGDGLGSSETLEGVIQTDAAINRGNSGGPLLNLRGEVMGINTAMAFGAENIGFAIPINQAKRAIESVKKGGKITVPFLGVRYKLVTEELKEKEKLSVDHGALLRGGDDGPAVVVGSPADTARLMAEDIILEFDGQKIDQDHNLASLVQKRDVGDRVKLKILRRGKEIEAWITLGERGR